MANYEVKAEETIWDIAKRYGVSTRELLDMNPNLNADTWTEGYQLMVPDTQASSVVQAPTPELTPEVGGLFEQMLKEFATAFQTFVSAPAFVRGLPTARAGAERGRFAPAWTRQEAGFLRYMEPELEARYGEQVMRQFAETGEIPELTAQEFLAGVNVREEMEMVAPYRRGGRGFGPPVTAARRLRF